jgi:hypothetical protein
MWQLKKIRPSFFDFFLGSQNPFKKSMIPDRSATLFCDGGMQPWKLPKLQRNSTI